MSPRLTLRRSVPSPRSFPILLLHAPTPPPPPSTVRPPAFLSPHPPLWTFPPPLLLRSFPLPLRSIPPPLHGPLLFHGPSSSSPLRTVTLFPSVRPPPPPSVRPPLPYGPSLLFPTVRPPPPPTVRPPSSSSSYGCLRSSLTVRPFRPRGRVAPALRGSGSRHPRRAAPSEWTRGPWGRASRRRARDEPRAEPGRGRGDVGPRPLRVPRRRFSLLELLLNPWPRPSQRGRSAATRAVEPPGAARDRSGQH